MSGEAIALILTGLGTFVTVTLTGWKALREGAAARQRDLMDDLAEERDRAQHDRRQEEIKRRYYEHHAGRVEEALRRGNDPPEANPPEWVDFKPREAKKR
jgi:hypothetical protein